jgi:hypothetical protein
MSEEVGVVGARPAIRYSIHGGGSNNDILNIYTFYVILKHEYGGYGGLLVKSTLHLHTANTRTINRVRF